MAHNHSHICSGGHDHGHHGHDHGHHGHDHGHQVHGHVHVNTKDSRALLIAMMSTGLIFVAQVVGGFISNSLALLSDAGHMLADLSALLISFAALRIASRPRSTYSKQYTYGLRRVEILAALANGVLLLAMCAYIAVESVQRFFSPEPVQTLPMLVVAVVGLLANALSAFVLHGSENLNTRSAYLHVITDLLSSVGVVAGGIVMYFTHISWIDPLLSLVIAVLIVRSGYRVVIEAGRILMESAPGHIDVVAVTNSIRSIGDVRDIHDIHIWQIGAGEVAISAHVVLNSFEHQEDVLQEVRELLKEQFAIGHSTIQIESLHFSEREQCDNCSW